MIEKDTSGYEKLSRDTLERSLKSVQFYKAWKTLDPGPRAHVDVRFNALPALNKTNMRNAFPSGLIPSGMRIDEGLRTGEIEYVKTSGSDDDSVVNIWHQPWWNASEKASWLLNRHSARFIKKEPAEAILTSPKCVGFACRHGELPVEKRRLGRFLYLNEKTDPSRWSQKQIERIAFELGWFKPRILEANPSFLSLFSNRYARLGLDVFQPELIVLTYEMPSAVHIRQIKRVFKSPVASSYGSTETGYVFMQCEQGRFHQNTRYCRVDFKPLAERHGGPLTGRIFVTTFHNPWCSILRFDIGDLVTLDDRGPCPCGRTEGLTLRSIDGRTTGVTMTLKGRLVTTREADQAIAAADKMIIAYKLEQTDVRSYRVKITAEEAAAKEPVQKNVRDALSELYGKDASIKIKFTTRLSPETTGKYRLTRALFPIDINEYTEYA